MDKKKLIVGHKYLRRRAATSAAEQPPTAAMQ